MDIERQVASHYTQGRLEGAILDALRRSGKDPDKLANTDLSPVDEFHLGWYAETDELARELGFSRDAHVLDIGSGIGGPARHLAVALGCRVTGIDLTEEFVQVASSLTSRCGLADQVSFRQGSALALPFEDGTFDGAVLMHVGMNIADKARLFSEARRVLKPGARFGVYDIMRTGEGPIPYPVPWAATEATSFVERPETYRRLLAANGFEIEKERNRRDFALALAREMREKIAREGMPPLGPHIINPAMLERFGNVMTVLEPGTIAPVEMIARAI
ncbi:MAG TPA: class I SAM-dependent methyltransferase [Microvirga sp.]|nr:class I SAM-dependent methyltransferase [Microvirga sp.]